MATKFQVIYYPTSDTYAVEVEGWERSLAEASALLTDTDTSTYADGIFTSVANSSNFSRGSCYVHVDFGCPFKFSDYANPAMEIERRANTVRNKFLVFGATKRYSGIILAPNRKKLAEEAENEC